MKIDNWLRRSVPYLKFLTDFVSFDILECMPLEQVDDCEQLFIVLNTEKCNLFSLSKITWNLLLNIQYENCVVHK